MNCKPNQRAIVTRTAGNPHTVHFLGPIWGVDPDNKSPIDCSDLRKGQAIISVADCILTPLPDDPGPDVEEDNEITNPASVEA